MVIQNKSDYINEALVHFNDTTTYKHLPGDPTQHICKQIRNILHEFYKKFYLTRNMYTFCLPPKQARLARIYFLKKIHKDPMGIRPIVSSCESPTENISQFIDYWLQPHTRLLPSFLKDTNQFIQEVENYMYPLTHYWSPWTSSHFIPIFLTTKASKHASEPSLIWKN